MPTPHVPASSKAQAPAGQQKNLAHDFDLEEASLDAGMDDESALLADPFPLSGCHPDAAQAQELMNDYDLDADAAARVSDLMDEYDLDADSAIAMDDADNDYVD